MALIIDGYNLIHAAPIVGRGTGPRGLERTRLALLDFLADTLEPAEIARTIIVFDAAGAPPGLPRQLEHRGLVVRFARGYPDADSLIEELIQADTSPRRLTVVSSDHRVQRAARRRKARAIDSEAWHTEMLRRKSARPEKGPPPVEKNHVASDVEFWLAQFTGAEPAPPSNEVFPPGYAEDLDA